MNANRTETILVRLPNWVGDVVMATPVLRALRLRFPEARIVAIGKPWSQDLLKGHPAVDEIITAPFQSVKWKFSEFQSLLKNIKAESAKWGILLPNSFGSALAFYLARIPNRLGYATNGRSFFLTHKVSVPGEKVHQIDYFLGVLKVFSSTEDWDRSLYFPLDDQKRMEADALWQKWGVTKADVIIGLNPGAAWGQSKRWLPEHFAAVGDLFQRELGARIVIFGGPEEVTVAEEIAQKMQIPPIITAGRDNLRILPALIARCNLFVTNDTGPMHIAASQGVRQVVLFGPTDPAETSYENAFTHMIRKNLECSPCFQPKCPLGHHDCMRRISAAEVFHAGVGLLSRSS